MRRIDRDLIEAAKNGNHETVKLLFSRYLIFKKKSDNAKENGADIHADYDSALRLSSENGHYETVKLLFSRYLI